MSKKSNRVTVETVSETEIENLSFDQFESEFGPIVHPKPTEDTYENLMTTLKTKSAVIRHLDSLGWKRGKIASFMNIRYQHVRNVLIQPLKKTND